MGRAPCCDKTKVKKGPWAPDEDAKLRHFVETRGNEGNWITLPLKAGLVRCGKSCRLRWTNYLRPNIKHGNFTEEEEKTIIDLHRTVGTRWSMIAAKLPGRTDNDIKNYWNTRLKKRLPENGGNSPSHQRYQRSVRQGGVHMQPGGQILPLEQFELLRQRHEVEQLYIERQHYQQIHNTYPAAQMFFQQQQQLPQPQTVAVKEMMPVKFEECDQPSGEPLQSKLIQIESELYDIISGSAMPNLKSSEDDRSPPLSGEWSSSVSSDLVDPSSPEAYWSDCGNLSTGCGDALERLPPMRMRGQLSPMTFNETLSDPSPQQGYGSDYGLDCRNLRGNPGCGDGFQSMPVNGGVGQITMLMGGVNDVY